MLQAESCWSAQRSVPYILQQFLAAAKGPKCALDNQLASILLLLPNRKLL
jgi:hypothetical protein